MTGIAIQDELKLIAAPLTLREEKFCREYVALAGNGTQAYLRVNPSVANDSAHVLAHRMLRKVTVQQKIAQLRQEQAEREVMSITERRQRLTAIARADQLDIWEMAPGYFGGPARRQLRALDEMTPEQRLAIQELSEKPTDNGMSITVKMYSAPQAIDLLNKMDGVYEEKVVHSGGIWVAALPDKLTPDEWRARFAPQLPAGSPDK